MYSLSSKQFQTHLAHQLGIPKETFSLWLIEYQQILFIQVYSSRLYLLGYLILESFAFTLLTLEVLF